LIYFVIFKNFIIIFLFPLNSPNGLDFLNRNANGLRCAIALHNCLKGRIFISFYPVLFCLFLRLFKSGRTLAYLSLSASRGYRLTYGYENYALRANLQFFNFFLIFSNYLSKKFMFL